MSSPIILPDLQPGDAEIRVSCWLIDPGDTVLEGDRVVEVLTSGITFDVLAPASGILNGISQPVDAVVAAGDVLGWIKPAAGV